jgi:hypothetical protein
MLIPQAFEDRHFTECEISFRNVERSEENLDRRVQTRGLYSSMDWLLFERPTCDTFSKQRRFAAIVITSGRLPGRGGLFERNAVPLNEVEEFFGRSRRDRVGVLAARAADRLDAELPQHVHLRTSVRADGVRERTMRQRCGSVILPT